jgi:hypothetical protein
MKMLRSTSFLSSLFVLFSMVALPALRGQVTAFGLNSEGPVVLRAVRPLDPFTVAGERGVLVGTQDGAFESWVLPVKLISHLKIEAEVAGYSVPIAVNEQAAQIEVRPDRTTITYAHIGFTLRQIMFASDEGVKADEPSTGPVVLFQVDSEHAVDLTFRFTPEMRWMWPKRNDGIPGAGWVSRPGGDGYYVLNMDYPGLAGAVTIPGATPGVMAPYQERPQVHQLELHLHYDPKRDGQGAKAKYFPLLMAVGTTPETAKAAALGETLTKLEAAIPQIYAARVAGFKKLLAESTSIETPDKALNEAFQWGVVSIEQLKAHEFASGQDALVAGYYASADSARPGFGWFFGRDSLYTLYAVNGYGDFALTRAELEFLMARQRVDGKIMHEFAQTAGDPVVDWKSFPYMYAAADATPLFLMAVRDYYRASGDVAFLKAHREALEKAWGFETAASSDTDHDGIYDNSQGTGWVESWPHDRMPHQEVYLALLDEEASTAYADLEKALGVAGNREEGIGNKKQGSGVRDQGSGADGGARAAKIKATIEAEYWDAAKGCYAFSHNLPGDPNGETDKSSTVYPAIGWWDDDGGKTLLAHPAECLKQWAGPSIATDWGLRDVAATEPFFDGMSYHQGSVWPLFTGWGALAEYRGGQPLAGEQMLMQNVDLTWAQDPGAVTELLSGDYFVPFGRSTSHQLWSSAMVITPALRGLFGISLDAASNTITVNPRLPAGWDKAEVDNLRIGDRNVHLQFRREGGVLRVSALDDIALIHVPKSDIPFEGKASDGKRVSLRSDLPGAKVGIQGKKPGDVFYSEVTIPLPAVELGFPSHALPEPGARPSQAKVLSEEYGVGKLTVTVSAPGGSAVALDLRKNRAVPKLRIEDDFSRSGSGAKAILGGILTVDGPPKKKPFEPTAVDLQFPKGEGWQSLTFTLSW